MQLVLGHHDLALGGRDIRLRDQHLGDKNGAGRGHDHGCQQVARLNALGDVHGHDTARHVGHAAGHDGHQFAARGAGEKRADGERSLGLAHEDGRATFMLSAPEMRMVLSMTQASPRMMICMRPMW